MTLADLGQSLSDRPSRWAARIMGSDQTCRLRSATYLLIANPADVEAAVRVSLMSADGIWATKTYAVGPRSRFTVDVEIEFGQFHVPEDPSFGRFLPHPFGALVESLGPVPIVLERALYSSGYDGIKWSAGAASLATKVRD